MVGILESKKRVSETPIGVLQYNTFIKQNQVTITDKATLASWLNISFSDIPFFTISGNNIAAQINVNYNITSASNHGQQIIDFFDFGRNCLSISNSALADCDNLRYCYFPALTTIGNRAFLTSNNIKLFVAQKALNLGDSSGFDQVFQFLAGGSDVEFYVHSNLETSNAGGLEGDLADIANRVSINFVQNEITPEAPTNLSVSEEYTSAVKIGFTVPQSTNSISSYIVFANGILNSIGYTDPNEVYAINLFSGIDYDIQVIAVDEYWNLSPISVSITANIIGMQPISNISKIENNATVLKLILTETNEYYPDSFYDVYVNDILNSENIKNKENLFAVGLLPSTSYNVKVTSKDSFGNTATSQNFSLTTESLANSDFLQTNLISLYQYNTLSGEQLKDELGFSNGTINGSPVLKKESPVGLAFQFTSGKWIDLNTSSIIGGRGGLTFGMWAKFDAIHNFVGFFGDSGFPSFTIRHVSNGSLQLVCKLNGVQRAIQIPNGSIGLEKFHLLMIEYDGSNIYFYVDNVLKGSTSGTGVFDTPTNTERVNRYGTNGCNIQIAQTFMYSTPRTSSQRNILWNNGKGISL